MDLQAEFLSAEDEYHIAKIQAAARGKKARKELAKSEKLTDEQKGKLDAAQKIANERRALYSDVHAVLGVPKSEYNSRPKLQQAHKYLEKHQIPQVLKSLMANVTLERPDDIRSYLIDKISDMKRKSGIPSTGFFTQENMETMFDMMDMHKTGSITIDQMYSTLQTVQRGRNAQQAIEKVCGPDATEVDKATFVKILKSELEAYFVAP
jgi:Ca2+-binding EF-hand superfamily protein